MSRFIPTRNFPLLFFLAAGFGIPQATPAAPPPPPALRRPVGVYAKVIISDIVKADPNADWDSYFNTLYATLLANPAISGLTLQLHWKLFNPAPGIYDWRYIRDAFDQAALWISRNPLALPKTIQFINSPGFNSPSWVLDSVRTADGSCDGLFVGQKSALEKNCGVVTFIGYNENADGDVLPLPWNATYKALWETYISHLNATFGSNPLLVSVSVAGPTAASDEMILPNNENTCPCHARQPSCAADCGRQPPAGQLQPNGLLPNDMWSKLLANYYSDPAYHNSNLAFVDEWKNAIQLFEQTFSGVTLVVTPGDGEGLVDFTSNFPWPTQSLFQQACQNNPDMSCAAVTQILGYFQDICPVNGNGKGSQVSGLSPNFATLANSDVGIGGVKLLAAETVQNAPINPILGGAQFDHSFSGNNQPEQEEFDVLATFFNGTKGITGLPPYSNLFTAVPLEIPCTISPM